MAAFSTAAVRLLLGLLVAAGVSGAIFIAVHASKNDSKAGVIGQLTETVTVAASTTPSTPTLTPSETTATLAPTLESTTAPKPTATPYPPLPPPPPKPDNPTSVTDYNITGGQWYRLRECIDFYIPAGWTFALNVGVGDPGGGYMSFTDAISGSVIVFAYDDFHHPRQTISDPKVGPAFDQIASTIEICQS